MSKSLSCDIYAFIEIVTSWARNRAKHLKWELTTLHRQDSDVMNSICFSIQRLCCGNDPTVGINIEISLQICVAIYWVSRWKIKANFWCTSNCSLSKYFIDFTFEWKSFSYFPFSSRLLGFPGKGEWYTEPYASVKCAMWRNAGSIPTFDNTFLVEVTGISIPLCLDSYGSHSIFPFTFWKLNSWTQPNMKQNWKPAAPGLPRHHSFQQSFPCEIYIFLSEAENLLHYPVPPRRFKKKKHLLSMSRITYYYICSWGLTTIILQTKTPVAELFWLKYILSDFPCCFQRGEN